ncbi:hypothetical protein [Mycolicibacterium smegmatis]|uniref:hypothetical protein n=1 Tax=Mycolicibacterium smegmatis TaxID=1772 RepID=UPI0005D86559|nr:hypothetical protein [Mycolicibacterium smegmatis]UAK54578.1 SCP2 sterol-binding domain-containing protein [Mycolicibacterium smegmatis]CKH63343.1 Uncharacterised protein [Mycolicibacterium smegmatis]
MTGFDTAWEPQWLAVVSDDAEFRLISRWTDVVLRLTDGRVDRSYRICGSTIAVADAGESAPAVTLTGSPEAWTAFLTATPEPQAHHILAMQRRREDFSIDGKTALLQNLNVLNRVMELMRTVASGYRRGAA